MIKKIAIIKNQFIVGRKGLCHLRSILVMVGRTNSTIAMYFDLMTRDK